MFVSVLSTSPSTRVPFNLEVSIIECYFLDLLRFNYGNGDRGSVNSSFSFRGRNPLNPMPACLIVELRQILAFNLQREFALANIRQAVLSAKLGGHFDVCCREVTCEKFRIGSTLGPSNFNNSLHCLLL